MGQKAVEEKSNEIIAILEFLDKNQNIIRKWCLSKPKTIKLMKLELLMNKKRLVISLCPIQYLEGALSF